MENTGKFPKINELNTILQNLINSDGYDDIAGSDEEANNRNEQEEGSILEQQDTSQFQFMIREQQEAGSNGVQGLIRDIDYLDDDCESGEQRIETANFTPDKS